MAEETGIDIRDKIDPSNVISFESFGENSHFFLAKGVSEEERLRHDSKELDEVLWMRLEDVRRLAKANFAQKARTAWALFNK